MKHALAIVILILSVSCKEKKVEPISEIIEPAVSKVPFVWEAANLYFLLTDRFNNGDSSNDINFDRTKATGKLRGFEGGDIKGITQKIQEGYFTDLGINAIWMTPLVEQVHGGTDEGDGHTYAYHGYWTKDWTAMDPNFGTEQDLKDLVEAAHKKGIRIVLDAVINHTGPVTDIDPVWPKEWVRTGPVCTYKSYKSTVVCTLVKNLPDIKTENNTSVELPEGLLNKWKTEGRYDQEMKELDEFFSRTGYPKAPRFYIIKWLTDYIKEYGIDGYRADTVRHIEESVWAEFKNECDYSFDLWKRNNPDKILDNNAFYLVGEVGGYNISGAKIYDFGDKKVNYFENGFHSLINFEFRLDSKNNYEDMFSKYNNILNGDLKDYGTLNFLSSHDEKEPFDGERIKPFETANRLLLSPGTSQVYYGDESARPLIIKGTKGDATLRSFMNWDDIDTNEVTKSILQHWQKLGKFRANHPSVGAGIHQMITKTHYVFSRSFSKDDYTDLVVVGLELPKGDKVLDVSKLFKDGSILHDAYSNQNIEVKNGMAKINSEYDIVLLENIEN